MRSEVVFDCRKTNAVVYTEGVDSDIEVVPCSTPAHWFHKVHSCNRDPYLSGKLVLWVQGAPVSTGAALDLYQILSESDTNLRQPVALEKQLLNEVDVDSEVGQSMLQLLQVTSATSLF